MVFIAKMIRAKRSEIPPPPPNPETFLTPPPSSRNRLLHRVLCPLLGQSRRVIPRRRGSHTRPGLLSDHLRARDLQKDRYRQRNQAHHRRRLHDVSSLPIPSPPQLTPSPPPHSIQTLTGEFDLIFIDANKDGYVDYLQRILSQKLLAPNGLILADNTLYRGLVAKKAIAHNPAAEPSMIAKAAQLDQFNVFVDHHPDLENVLLAAFDGLNFIRYKDGVRK